MKKRTLIGLAIVALLINTLLFVFIPLTNYMFKNDKGSKKPSSHNIEIELELPQTLRKNDQQEIKEIQSVQKPMDVPTLNPRHVQMNLGVIGGSGGGGGSDGGDGVGIGGNGRGVGSGNGVGIGQVMTYSPGETDTDAEKTGGPIAPDSPQRALREGIGGQVVIQWVVTESGNTIEIEVLQEEPKGYGFGIEAQKFVKFLKFRPAKLNGVAVRQRVKQKILFVQK